MAFHKSEYLMEELLLEFECPVCTQFMHPPIRQCAIGHSCCKDCYRKLKVCPTCRQVLNTSARSFVLEKLHAKLFFPCKYRDQGCKTEIQGADIEDHEFQCNYGGSACPLKVLNNCPWYGRSKGIVDHCKEHHPNNIFLSNIQRLTCSNFLRDGTAASATYYMIFSAFKEIFKCVWEINFTTGFMRWCVFRIVTEPRGESGDYYDFIIDIQNQQEHGHKLAVKGVCPRLMLGEEEVINNQQFVFTHYDMVKDFCKDNDLTYTVKIVQRITDFALSEGNE